MRSIRVVIECTSELRRPRYLAIFFVFGDLRENNCPIRNPFTKLVSKAGTLGARPRMRPRLSDRQIYRRGAGCGSWILIASCLEGLVDDRKPFLTCLNVTSLIPSSVRSLSSATFTGPGEGAAPGAGCGNAVYRAV
jgi:hypothetical protein